MAKRKLNGLVRPPRLILLAEPPYYMVIPGFLALFPRKKNLADTKNEQRETWYTNGIPYLVVTSMSNDSDRCHKKVNDSLFYAIRRGTK